MDQEAIQRLSRRAAAGDLHSARALAAMLEARLADPVEETGIPKDPAASVLADAAKAGDVSAAEALVELLRSGPRGPRGPRLVAQFRTQKMRMTAPGAFVIREFDRGDSSEFVVAWRNDQTGGYSGGGYFESLADAVADFAERVASWGRRYL